MTDREELVELLMNIPQVNHTEAAVQGMEYVFRCAADYLIANGVTFATDISVGDKVAPTADNLSAISEQKWIPVTERLPDLIPCDAGTAYSEAVNVLTTGRKVLTAIWDGSDFIADAEFWEAEGEVITHWTPVPLPLPEPPKEE